MTTDPEGGAIAKTGKNMRITVGRAHREALRRCFEVLGAQHHPVRDTFEAFVLEDGFSLGVNLVEGEGIAPETARDLGVWIEFLVADVEATNAALTEAGVQSFRYEPDPENLYFWVPGGPVFRLGKAA